MGEILDPSTYLEPKQRPVPGYDSQAGFAAFGGRYPNSGGFTGGRRLLQFVEFELLDRPQERPSKVADSMLVGNEVTRGNSLVHLSLSYRKWNSPEAASEAMDAHRDAHRDAFEASKG